MQISCLTQDESVLGSGEEARASAQSWNFRNDISNMYDMNGI